LDNELKQLRRQLESLKHDAIKYQLLKETAGFAMLTMKKYVFIDCNRMAEQIFGRAREEILGKEPFILSPKYQPDGSPSDEKAIGLINSTLDGEAVRFEWQHIRGDGTRFYADVSLNKIAVNNEEYIQVILRDISDEKISKERLENQNRIIRHLNLKYQRQNKDYEKLLDEIKQHQDQTNAILSTITDGVVVFSLEKFLYINKQMLYMVGYMEEELSPQLLFTQLGLELDSIPLPDSHGDPYESWPAGINNDKYFRLKVVPMKEKGVYMAHLTDYTEIRKVNRTIEESEFKFRSIFHSSTDGIVLASSEFVIYEVNNTFIKNYGYKAHELTGVSIDTLIIGSKDEKFSHWLEAASGEEIKLTEFQVFSSDGSLSPVEVGSRKIKLGFSDTYLIILRDISYRKKFEQQLFNSIIKAEETERKRIAANLHDELGPVLSSMKLYLNTLKAKSEGHFDYLAGQFEDLVSDAVGTVRSLSEDLSPISLFKGGLEKAIQKRLDALRDFYRIELSSTLNEKRFEEQIEINTFRVINELLNNTLKHANASSINLKLIHSKSDINIHYEDDGVGFEPNLSEHELSGRGVSNILGRLKSMNATYEIESGPGEGVSYNIVIPIGK